MSISSLTDFCDEILLRILKFCTTREIGLIAVTCQKMRQVASDKTLWTHPKLWDISLINRRVALLNPKEKGLQHGQDDVYALYPQYREGFGKQIKSLLELSICSICTASRVIGSLHPGKIEGFLNEQLTFKLLEVEHPDKTQLGRDILLLVHAGATTKPHRLVDKNTHPNELLLKLQLPEDILCLLFQTAVFQPRHEDVLAAIDLDYSWDLITEMFKLAPTVHRIIRGLTTLKALEKNAPQSFFTIFFSKYARPSLEDWLFPASTIPDAKILEFLTFVKLGAGIVPKRTLSIHPYALIWAILGDRPTAVISMIEDLIDRKELTQSLLELLVEHLPVEALKKFLERCQATNKNDEIGTFIQSYLLDNPTLEPLQLEKLFILIHEHHGLLDEKLLQEANINITQKF